MIYFAPTIIIILCYVIIISVAVTLAALLSLSNSLLTILLFKMCIVHCHIVNKYKYKSVPSFLPSFL